MGVMWIVRFQMKMDIIPLAPPKPASICRSTSPYRDLICLKNQINSLVSEDDTNRYNILSDYEPTTENLVSHLQLLLKILDEN